MLMEAFWQLSENPQTSNSMKYSIFLFLFLCCFACNEKSSEVLSVTVRNTLNFDRSFETVEIDIKDIQLNRQSLEVRNSATYEVLISQIVDYNGKGKLILFQPEIKANSKAVFTISLIPSEEKNDSTLVRCYSRFVPERTDDYAWENNRVAFRAFGPTAQKMNENGMRGGTLSSGIDAWLKRVDYPIIDKWYHKELKTDGSYHKDTGEGLDNFHVGISRGVGGTAIKTDSTYTVSKNFVSYKTITNGPIRAEFVLEYAPYNANGAMVKETKFISLDYGQNLSRHKVEVSGTDTLSVGLTLHEKDGITTANTDEGWMSYWEPFDDSELGQGIVIVEKNALKGFDKYETEEKDKSNLYAHLKVSENGIDYYAGFGWKKSNQFQTKDKWNNYLSRFSKCLDNPLEVTIELTN